MKYQPDFNQLLKVLSCQAPDRPVLFELFMGDRVYRHAIGELRHGCSKLEWARAMCKAFAALGYDYASVHGSEYGFPNRHGRHGAQTLSLNESPMITDRESFDAYPWMDARACDYASLKDIEADLPAGMKLMVLGPSGVLENTIKIVGYDNLCYMLYDDEALVADVFERVGGGLLEYYRIVAAHDSVGLLMCNDDWGFNTQTMISPEAMRKYVFPWYKEIVRAAHAAGKPAVLHSCGNFADIIPDLFDMGFDGRHSYEDNILPVEEAYELFAGKMAVLGGIDIDFLCRSTPEEVRARAMGMLQRAGERGGYAVGTGNSVPDFCPLENYLAMISVRDEG